ncbi:MAG TPA: response regulator [Flavobacterium sp.]|jgi:CheY-like chemotaxis protein
MKNQTMIFYVDDDADDAQIVEEVFKDLGEATCVFQDSKDMMQLLDNPPPSASIILIDLNMPRVSGLEVLQKIRENSKFDDIPVIIISNNVQPTKIEESKRLGANLFMTKGFTMQSIKKGFQYVLSIDWKAFRPDDEQFIYET